MTSFWHDSSSNQAYDEAAEYSGRVSLKTEGRGK
ncbi:hypothetical protein LEMLEM_LOCUS21700 [Lemmus lemmus]